MPDGQTAARWISRAWNGDVSADNAGSRTIASYQVSPGGQLIFLRNASAGTGAAPLDNAISADGHDLSVLIGNQDELAGFSVGPDARLTAAGTQALPGGSAGARRLTLRAALTRRQLRTGQAKPRQGRVNGLLADPALAVA